MRADNITGKCAPGVDNFSSVVDRMHMELGSKFFNSLCTKSLRGPIGGVLSMVPPTPKRMVWRTTEAP